MSTLALTLSQKRITVNTRSRVKRPLKAPNSSPSTRITISELSKSPTPKAATCQVCFEDVEPGLQLPTPVTAASDHKHDGMCVTCVRQAIEAQSTLVAFEEIMCPFPDFGVALAHADMQRFAPKEVFARYDEFLNRKALEELPDYQQCSNAACNNGGFIDLNDSFMTCASCATVTGITCKTRYHPGLTHAESLKALE